MNKYILILILFFTSAIRMKAQSPSEMMKERKEKIEAEQREYNEGLVDTSKRYFYKTYNDYVLKNPVSEIKYTGKRKILMETESVLVAEDEDFVYKKIKELPYWGFIDEWGQLERIYKNHCYFVLDTGKICLYVKAIDANMVTDKNGNRKITWLSENSAGYKDYISEGVTSDIVDFTDKKFQSVTSSNPEVFEQFQQDVIDPKAKDKRSAKTFMIEKYVIMYNKLE